MKKRADHLWPRLTEFPNLELAFRKAALGKRGRQSVAAFEKEAKNKEIQCHVGARWAMRAKYELIMYDGRPQL